MAAQESDSKLVAVIGGGPAGLVAAETLADAGLDVIVFDHKRSLGRKFLLAGRGGLNITHSEPLDDFIRRYGPGAHDLEPALRAFGPQELRAWCASHDEPTFVGTSGRVFPESFRATPLLRSWLRRLDSLGVRFETEHRWVGWLDQHSLEFRAGNDRRSITPDATVFALGGASWPRVGSDGGWVQTFEDAGIAISPLGPANSGVLISWSDVVRDRFAGAPIKNTVFSIDLAQARGDGIVTQMGLEGGPIYALGPALRKAVAGGGARIELDLHPDLNVDQLTQRLSKRRPKSSVSSWLNSAGVPAVAQAIARDATANQLPTDPEQMARLLKRLALPVSGMAPIERAISTSGGVGFDQIDEQFMLRSRPGNFVAGEMLDWEAPTGGYLLQACFSTGVAAARGVIQWLRAGAE